MKIYYLSILFITALGIWCDKKIPGKQGRAVYLASAGLLLTAIASLRYAIGFDYYSYRSIYYGMAGQSIGCVIAANKHEALFFLFTKLCHSSGLSYTAYLTVINIFLHSVAMWFIRRFSKIPWLSVFLYITLQFLAHNMNLVRQSIALAFFLLAFPSLQNRNLVSYLLLMTAGGLFHNTLFFMIPLYFLLPSAGSVKSILSTAAAALALYALSGPVLEGLRLILPERYTAYQNSLYWQGNSFSYVILPALYLFLALLFRRRLLEINPSFSAYVGSAVYTFLINLFITKHFILERFSVYPFALSIVLLPEIAALCGPPPRSLRPALPLVMVLAFGAAYFCFAAGHGFHHVYPYISLFDRAVSSHFILRP